MLIYLVAFVYIESVLYFYSLWRRVTRARAASHHKCQGWRWELNLQVVLYEARLAVSPERRPYHLISSWQLLQEGEQRRLIILEPQLVPWSGGLSGYVYPWNLGCPQPHYCLFPVFLYEWNQALLRPWGLYYLMVSSPYSLLHFYRCLENCNHPLVSINFTCVSTPLGHAVEMDY